MKGFKHSRLFLSALIAFIIGTSFTGCGMVRGSISDSILFSILKNSDTSDEDHNSEPIDNMSPESGAANTAVSSERESASALNETSETSTEYMGAEKAVSDRTAPVIDAQDQTVPYGTYLQLKDIASIVDDQDESPVLELTSVRQKNGAETDNTGNTSTTATSATTVYTAATASSATTATTVTTAYTASTANTAAASFATSTAENASSSTTSNIDRDSAASSNELSDIGSAGSTLAAEREPDAINKAKDGYLFSNPGLYVLNLSGTDRSGNQAIKSITVTVIDSTAPELSGLRETFTLTDQDTNPPDYMEGIAAADEIDGTLTESIKVDDNKVQYGTPGTYSVEYSVSDLSGNAAAASVPVVIKDATAPEITLSQSTLDLFVTDGKPDYSAFVIAKDTVDGDVKSSMTVDDKSVKYSCPGTYAAILYVLDKSGNKAEKTIKINVSGGWKTKGNKTFYYSPKDGSLYHNWGTVDGKKYYFDPDDGHVRHGWKTIDGQKYYLDPDDGHVRHGWKTIDGQKYYLDPDDGHVRHGWRTIDGRKYYLDKNDGHLLTGLQTIKNKQYLLDSNDGHQLTGWQTIGGNQYYFDPDDGHMRHTWVSIDGEKYYFDPTDGFMYTGTHYIDGDQYDFGSNGVAEKVVVQQRSSVTGNNSASNNSANYNSEISYIGNKNSRIFHHSWCASVRKMKDYNKVGFGSRDDAVNSGYRPCKNCNP